MKSPERLSAHLIGDGFVVLAVLGWWLTARSMPEFVLPSPARAGAVLIELFVEPEFLKHIAASTGRILAAMALAFLLGTGLAAVARFFPAWSYAVDRRLVPVVNSFPSVGL